MFILEKLPGKASGKSIRAHKQRKAGSYEEDEDDGGEKKKGWNLRLCQNDIP